MNRGRNIAILLLCLVVLSLLTFLVNLNRTNTSGVVDDVRYIQTESTENTKSYEFWFVEGDKMTGVLTIGEEDYTLVITDYDYSYTIKGESRDDAEVTAFDINDPGKKVDNAYDIFTRDMIVSLVFGKVPVLSVTQAIIVAAIAIVGGLILGKCEELWSFFNKDKTKEYPEYSELKKYKVAGGIVIGISVILLLIFVIL